MAYQKGLYPTPTLPGHIPKPQTQKPIPDPAYRLCSPQSLRILATFIVHRASVQVLDLPQFSPHFSTTQTSCEQINILTALARTDTEGARIFNFLLTLLVEREARAYRTMTPWELAGQWKSSPELVRGRNLAAFLWVLIRNSSTVTRSIEEKVLRSLECDCFRLLTD